MPFPHGCTTASEAFLAVSKLRPGAEIAVLHTPGRTQGWSARLDGLTGRGRQLHEAGRDLLRQIRELDKGAA